MILNWIELIIPTATPELFQYSAHSIYRGHFIRNAHKNHLIIRPQGREWWRFYWWIGCCRLLVSSPSNIPHLSLTLSIQWQQQAITWASVDQLSVRYWGVHMRAVSQETTKTSILDMCLEKLIKDYNPISKGPMCLVNTIDSQYIAVIYDR